MSTNLLKKAKLGDARNYPFELRKLKNSSFSNLVKDKATLLSIGNYSLHKGNLIRTTLSKELLWAANIVDLYKSSINEFLLKKKKYEEMILKENYVQAADILNDIERDHGYSLWLIEAKIVLLQLNDGLDQQKRFIISMYNNRNSSEKFDEFFYLSYLISQRNEPSLKAESFIKSIKKAILRDENEEDSENALWLLIRYFVLGQNAYSRDEIDYLLSWTQTLSIYDLYHSLVYSLINLIYLDDVNDSDLKIVLRCLSSIDDSAVDNLIAFCNKKNNLADTVDTDVFNYNNKLYFEVLCHKSNKDNDLLSYNFLSAFIDKLRDVFQVNTTRRESFEWLQKNYMNFKHVQTIHFLFEISNVLSHRKYNKQDAFFTSFLSENRASLFLLRDVELQGRRLSFKKQDVSNLYQSIQVIYDTKILDLPIIRPSLESLQKSDFLLKDILYSIEKIKHFIHEGKFSDAFSMTVELCLSNEYYVDILPIAELVKNRELPFYRKIKNQSDVAIVIYLYIQKHNKDDRQWFYMKLCCQVFTEQQKVNYHHELLLSNFQEDIKRTIFFLKNICIPEVLEVDIERYQSNRSLLDERIKICKKILEIEHDDKVERELEEIVKKTTIIDGVNTVENSGVTVDYKGYRLAAYDRVKDDFIRFHALHEAGIKRKTNSEQEKTDSTDYSYNPNEESKRVSISLLQELKWIFLSHPEYGLDYYLSMRIRHGRFIGVLRGPLERKRLITKYSDIEKSYLENEYWREIYKPHLSTSQLNILLKALEVFSEKFDELVTEYRNNVIQIKSSEKPDGQYQISITENLLEDMSQQKDLDLFLKQTFDYFFIMIEVCSKQVQQKIKTELADSIRKLIFELQEKINPFCSTITCISNSILDDLNHLRTDIDGAIKQVTAWFETSTFEKQDIRFFTFKNLVEIGLARTRQSRLDFSPEIKYELDLHLADVSVMAFDPTLVPSFSDLFSILFDNISDHSGENKNIVINITANNMHQLDNRLTFCLEIRNKAMVNKDKLTIVNKIKEDIELDKIKSIQEGHSGYHKIKVMGMVDELDFGFEGDEFYTRLLLVLDYRGTIENVDEESYEKLYIN